MSNARFASAIHGTRGRMGETALRWSDRSAFRARRGDRSRPSAASGALHRRRRNIPPRMLLRDHRPTRGPDGAATAADLAAVQRGGSKIGARPDSTPARSRRDLRVATVCATMLALQRRSASRCYATVRASQPPSRIRIDIVESHHIHKRTLRRAPRRRLRPRRRSVARCRRNASMHCAAATSSAATRCSSPGWRDDPGLAQRPSAAISSPSALFARRGSQASSWALRSRTRWDRRADTVRGDLHAVQSLATAASHGGIGLGGGEESTGTRMTHRRPIHRPLSVEPDPRPSTTTRPMAPHISTITLSNGMPLLVEPHSRHALGGDVVAPSARFGMFHGRRGRLRRCSPVHAARARRPRVARQ